MSKKIIFISIDGMCDPLGQSQVLPYLTGLSEKGFAITIISCEKRGNFEKNKNIILAIITKYKLEWKYCFYENRIPILSQRNNFINLRKLTEKEVLLKDKNVLLHCRSYLPALIGLQCKRKYGVKFIFDMRGFWADERIDGKIWNLKNPIHNLIYKYFKGKEKQMLGEADYIVTLTHEAKKIVSDLIPAGNKPIHVIPCCVDTNHFAIQTKERKLQIRKELNIPENSFVVGYLGSLGTWYMLNEMLDFFIELKKKKNNTIFFFVTPDDKEQIRKVAEEKNILITDLLIKSANRDQVPGYISVFDAGLFFIKPSFSKRGSSPTKLAELLSCGIPVITNAGVGDCDAIVHENNCGVVIKDFTLAEYEKALDALDNYTHKTAEYYRNVSLTNFSLEKGVSLYEEIYLSLTK